MNSSLSKRIDQLETQHGPVKTIYRWREYCWSDEEYEAQAEQAQCENPGCDFVWYSWKG